MSYPRHSVNRGRLAALLVASSCALWSQSSAIGSLSLTVKAPGGKLVPGAVVTLDSGRGAVIGTTDANGKFLFQNLLPGAIKVKVRAKGLADEVLSATVYVNQTTALNVTLKPVFEATIEVLVSVATEITTPLTTAVNGTDYSLDQILL